MYDANTRGAGKKSKPFSWDVCNGEILIYPKSKNRIHKYSVAEVSTIIMWLQCKFKSDTFPLANNVKKLWMGTEMEGLGLALYIVKNNTTFAQGSSYLGVVLEKLGVFEFDPNKKVISWKLNSSNKNLLGSLKAH